MPKRPDNKTAKSDDGGILLPVLVVLLILVGAVEAALLSYIGVRSVPYVAQLMNPPEQTQTVSQVSQSRPTPDASENTVPPEEKISDPALQQDASNDVLPEQQPTQQPVASDLEPAQTVPDSQPEQNAPQRPVTEMSGPIVYVSNAGKIHSISDCSGMKYYTEMDKAEAESRDYEWCENCW